MTFITEIFSDWSHHPQIQLDVCYLYSIHILRVLVVSMSDYGTRRLGLIPGWAHIYQCLFFFSFFVFMLNYFILVIWNYKNDKPCRSLTFYIELCTKFLEAGVNLALLKKIAW